MPERKVLHGSHGAGHRQLGRESRSGAEGRERQRRSSGAPGRPSVQPSFTACALRRARQSSPSCRARPKPPCASSRESRPAGGRFPTCPSAVPVRKRPVRPAPRQACDARRPGSRKRLERARRVPSRRHSRPCRGPKEDSNRHRHPPKARLEKTDGNAARQSRWQPYCLTLECYFQPLRCLIQNVTGDLAVLEVAFGLAPGTNGPVRLSSLPNAKWKLLLLILWHLWARGARVWAGGGQRPALSTDCPHGPEGSRRPGGLVHKSTGSCRPRKFAPDAPDAPHCVPAHSGSAHAPA